MEPSEIPSRIDERKFHEAIPPMDLDRNFAGGHRKSCGHEDQTVGVVPLRNVIDRLAEPNLGMPVGVLGKFREVGDVDRLIAGPRGTKAILHANL